MTDPYGSGDPNRRPVDYGPPPWATPQQPLQQPQYGQPQYGQQYGQQQSFQQAPSWPGPAPYGQAGWPTPTPQRRFPIGWVIGAVAAVIVVVVGVIAVPKLFGGDGVLGGSSDEQQIIAQFEGYVEDLGDGDWSAAADRICRDSPARKIVQGIGLVAQTLGSGQTLDFGIDVKNVKIDGDTATVDATFDFPGLENAPTPGAAKKVDGQWCLVS
ncbi:hypothetical protein nbrc107696_44750 [Gordonia spumicola]|uniref:DUF4878 domain-containing protein n=1 Tax=Gordonia spumicola TaxID=589161 RepID=A0A7I9VF64_9ACTN|nr:hypothetical protein [Gordonia spumicola]GEE04029.1 hypothetical protein nbrc107696_44750 [Gordonia spumicola]